MRKSSVACATWDFARSNSYLTSEFCSSVFIMSSSSTISTHFASNQPTRPWHLPETQTKPNATVKPSTKTTTKPTTKTRSCIVEPLYRPSFWSRMSITSPLTNGRSPALCIFSLTMATQRDGSFPLRFSFRFCFFSNLRCSAV